MIVWGLIVAGLMLLGVHSVFAELIVVLSVLGHAPWRLHRKLVPAIDT